MNNTSFFISIAVVLSLMVLNSCKDSEQNQIQYNGAVQFDYGEKIEEIIPEMKTDLQRLEQIGRRFSKMGSRSDIEKFDLSERIERIVTYLNKRLPSLGKKVDLVNDIQPGIMIEANGSLLAWSIENIIRNGVDAIDRKNGKVSVSLRQKSDGIKIRVHDNGKGIPKKDWRNIM